jgi:hypothetical protein
MRRTLGTPGISLARRRRIHPPRCHHIRRTPTRVGSVDGAAGPAWKNIFRTPCAKATAVNQQCARWQPAARPAAAVHGRVSDGLRDAGRMSSA